MNPRRTALWAFVVTAIALLMVTLDNLVVTTALPVIRSSSTPPSSSSNGR